MSMLKRLKALLEAMYIIYQNALLESPQPPEKPLTREELQEKERQEALRDLEETKQQGQVFH